MSEFTLLVVIALVFCVVRLFLRLTDTQQRLETLAKNLAKLENELRNSRSTASSPTEAASPAPAPALSAAQPLAAAETPQPFVPEPRSNPSPAVPPPLPVFRAESLPAIEPGLPRETFPPKPETPAASIPTETKPILPPFSLEAFLGAKMLSWLGGLAMFFGVIFFLKYSVEHGWISAQMRLIFGALVGAGLVGGGLFVPRPKYAITAQTLCATGLVILYGVTFAAHGVYHFIGATPAFAIMTLLTAAAFILAVWMEAQVVAILGLLAGFLTPILFSTGQDNPGGLFGYIALLDAGLIAVALRRPWRHLVTLAAVATVLMQMIWYANFFTPEKVFIGATIFLGFEVLFLVPFWLCNREDAGEKWTINASGITAVAALAFSALLLTDTSLGEKPWIVLSILLLADAGLVVWPVRRTALQVAPLLAGGVVFVLLGLWNVRYLNDALLYWALGYFLVFAAFHTALPIVLRRLRPTAATPRWAQVFPALGLILMLWPALRIGASTALWGAVLLADLAAIALAAFTASLLGVVAALVLTLIAVALWLAQTPVDNPSLGGLLAVLAGFAALFCAASVFLQRRLSAKDGTSTTMAPLEREALQHLPAISAVMPFLLLISVVIRLHPLNPTPIFGVAALLVVILLGLARWSNTLALPPIALGCVFLLESTWHTQTQPLPNPGLALAWYLGFAAIISAFPFVFESRASRRVTPWATAALAPVLHYPLFYHAAAQTWPAFGHNAPGLIPAAFALPLLAACFYLRSAIAGDNPARLGILAWFGGAALFFITLIFPAQFEREWLQVSWALEGAALCWLFHRLPHPGLRGVGFGLLSWTFLGLLAVPGVLEFHPRSGVPIWNWYLYTYGIVAAAQFAGGWLLAPPRHRIGAIHASATVFTYGTILLFILLNIEIADYFATGPTLTFDFSGNLARDMTYSIAWALFALALLVVGMKRHVAPVRYAGIALFVVTLLKLFFHDLASLDQLYRIGAFIAVAVLLMGASWLYQRFLAADEKPAPPPKE